MALAIPDWLARREGDLKLGPDKQSYFVMLGGKPLYSLTPIPVRGKLGCIVAQTNNGRRLDCSGTYHSLANAVQGGLESLRQALGW